ncbi:hypothetical protein BO71DRAFT_316886 [Aspergillus ellipticus CBS 707.79]|uniref:Uncharacterized protein n=1 Tax=Aspergillus ellipticus CBS 707.79 TaxID=1448320 RepID=A0A319DVN1_9EURO|nr:hypothetical protein BO71DRAFT_316886 [Aspergillus ellipticus CBS 707.79]
MAPIRRYLRISKYTILECRIYLENPSDVRWLLSSRDAVLPRIFAAIRPLVRPKLREENERLFARKKGKPVKDVIVDEDFEIALFLRESRTRHSLLTRHKEFDDGGDSRGNASAARTQTAGSSGSAAAAAAEILIESDDESGLEMQDIPEEETTTAAAAADAEDGDNAGGKRRRDADGENDSPDGRRRTSKRRKEKEEEADAEDKKMCFRTNYEGFNIYGWVLCLLVTRKGEKAGTRATPSEPGRQVLMEEWISTQAQGDMAEE